LGLFKRAFPSLVHSLRQKAEVNRSRGPQVRDFDSALNDFNFSLSLREPPEPYTLACRSLASIKLQESQGTLTSSDIDSAMDDLDHSIDMYRRLAIGQEKMSTNGTMKETSGVERLRCEKEDGLPRVAYQCLLLRASARQAQYVLMAFITVVRIELTSLLHAGENLN